jgi:hypothetical protein
MRPSAPEEGASTAALVSSPYLGQQNASTLVYAESQRQNRARLTSSVESRALARAAMAAKRAAWPPVREVSAGLTRFHKALNLHYGLRLIPDAEPTTVKRLRQLLRRAGVSQAQAESAAGCSLERYLQLNPGWPLWEMVSATLETYNLDVADAVLRTINPEVIA